MPLLEPLLPVQDPEAKKRLLTHLLGGTRSQHMLWNPRRIALLEAPILTCLINKI